MANRSFGVREINIIGSAGTPTIESPNNLNLQANTVAISTDVTVGGTVKSNLIIDSNYLVGVSTATPTSKLHVVGNTLVTGVTTSSGGFVGNLTGNVTGNVTGNLTGTATTATNLSSAANITSGIIDPARLSGTYDISITGLSQSSNEAINSISVIGGISSVTNSLVTGNSLITGISTVGLANTSTPPSNSQMSFELISNTQLRIKVRGTDGILRSANITLS